MEPNEKMQKVKVSPDKTPIQRINTKTQFTHAAKIVRRADCHLFLAEFLRKKDNLWMWSQNQNIGKARQAKP